MTELDRLLERNRRANDLKRGLDRGIDHDELRELIDAYRKADFEYIAERLEQLASQLKATEP